VGQFEHGRLSRIIRADSGKWTGPRSWELHNGIMHYFPVQDPARLVVVEFKSQTITVPISLIQLADEPQSQEEYSARALKEKVERDKASGAPYAGDLIQYHLRFSIPFASVIFSLLGCAMGGGSQRVSRSLGLGLSLATIVGYYALQSVCFGLAYAAPIPIGLAVWFPNIVTGLLSLLLLYRQYYR